MVRFVLDRYDRRSLVALGVLLVTYGGVMTNWRYLMVGQTLKDPLLLGIWAFMTAVLCWAIEPRRDLVRAAVGLAGGLVIEAWGTVTELWHYFTAERPPLWIIPAWPVAAITIDRLSKGLEPFLPQASLRVLWWASLPPFVVWMTFFVAPTLDLWATRAAVLGMVVVTCWPGRVRQDVALMLAGAGLGIFLEYWGTSRRCWTYYTAEVPPAEAIVAHGFAAIAFQRGADLVEAALDRRAPWSLR